MSKENHIAPGQLEFVRTFLNTWHLSNSTRIPEDRLDAFATEQDVSDHNEVKQLKRLRDDLRAIVEGKAKVQALNVWLREMSLAVVVEADEEKATLCYKHEAGLVGDVLSIVLKAIEDDQWGRLKACPDCRLVFFDHTRNASKRWCGMYAGGPQGRACGTIAKVRRYRARHKSNAS